MSAIQAQAPAPTSPPLPSDAASNAALEALYSAALGHGPKERYLRRFAQFDAAGRTSPGWNGAASLCTLSWAVLRQLWVPALLYVAVVEGLALLALGPGRWLLQEQPHLQWPLLGAMAALACVLPGMYGDALLHTETRKRIVTALTQTQSVAEACIFLSHTASSRKRLQRLALANVAMALAAAAALSVWLPWSSGAPSAAALPASSSVASPAGPELTVEEALTQAPRAGAAMVTPMPEPVPATTPEIAAAVEPGAPAEEEAAPPAAAPAPQPSPAVAGTKTPQGLKKSAPAPATRSPARSAPFTASSEPPRAVVVSTGTTPAAPGLQPGYYLNAGLFAEEANARKVQAQLLNANLQAFRQPLDTAQGQRIRVRVGPFRTRQEATAVRTTLRSMALEAVVSQQ